MSSATLRPLILPALVLALAGALATALVLTRPANPAPPPQERSWTVEVQAVSRETLAPVLPLFAQVENPRTARISAAVNADVVAVPAQEGQRVAAGALLVQLESRDLALTLAQREADVAEITAQQESERRRHSADQASLTHELKLLELTRRTVAREEKLASTKVASQARLEEARQAEERQALAVRSRRLALETFEPQMAQIGARRARAEALRDQARRDLERATLLAPFAGRVAQVAVSPGDRVRPGDRLVTLYDIASLELRAQIPSPRIATVRASLASDTPLQARAIVDGAPVTAKLERLAAETEANRGGVDALFRVTEGNDLLALGRTVELLLELPAEPGVVALPASALYGGQRIYRLAADRLESLEVTRVGEFRRGDEVLQLVRAEGLADGDRVLTTQLPNASDGLLVQAATP